MVNTMFVMKSLKQLRKPQCGINVGHQECLGKVHMADLHGLQYKIVAVQTAIHFQHIITNGQFSSCCPHC